MPPPDGGLRGGEALRDYLTQLTAKVARKRVARIGFLEGATYPDGTSVALVAATNEFGRPSKGQPPRPFFRNMIAAKKDTWGKALGDLLTQNSYDVDLSLDQAGAGIAGQLVESIKDLTDPPLKPSTVAKKKFAKPLIDSGHLWQSVSHDVADAE